MPSWFRRWRGNSVSHFRRVSDMRVALIDPSLFTLPYDAALAAGLRADGHEPILYGRRPNRDDGSLDGAPLVESFYRLATTPLVRSLPKTARLAVKGLDHVVSM